MRKVEIWIPDDTRIYTALILMPDAEHQTHHAHVMTLAASSVADVVEIAREGLRAEGGEVALDSNGDPIVIDVEHDINLAGYYTELAEAAENYDQSSFL